MLVIIIFNPSKPENTVSVGDTPGYFHHHPHTCTYSRHFAADQLRVYQQFLGNTVSKFDHQNTCFHLILINLIQLSDLLSDLGEIE